MHKMIQKVGDNTYHAEYKVEGDKITVTCDGAHMEEPRGLMSPLYQARDLLRAIVRDKEKAAA